MADDVSLRGPLHEVFVQGACGIFGCLDFAAGVVGGQLAFPLPALLADAGGLQVVVYQTYGIRTHRYIAHHATVGALLVSDETVVRQWIAAEYGDRQYALDGVFRRDERV